MLSVTKGKFNRKEIVLINAHDITAQKKAKDILKNLAIKDELTGLYNRHFLDSIIQPEIERSKRYDYPLSVAILDVDNFKIINDKFGHPEGDKVLKEIAEILKEKCQSFRLSNPYRRRRVCNFDAPYQLRL